MLQRGLMMDRPLLISAIIEHAAAQFGDTTIVSRETHGPIFRYTYAECAVRVRRLANALRHLGLDAGTSVASIAWNNHRHLEAYYAVSGGGMVMHTCNPRLHPEQLIYIINHAEDRMVLFDATFAPLVKGIAARCPDVLAWVALSDAANMPAGDGMPNIRCYEELLAAQAEDFEWPEFDEHTAAALCYTSGTTGNPKGALYSHRSMVLNAIVICMPGILGISSKESILPIVPMFHINGWCIPYAALIGGAKLVLPGPRLDGASLHELMETEKRGRSHGLVRSVAVPRTTRTAVLNPRAGGVGRFGGAARIDRNVLRPLRHRSAAGLGDDGNRGGGHIGLSGCAAVGFPRGREACRHRQTGEIGVRRGNQTR